ncbi:hypothetical protein HYW42_05700 [Candidatus Daviesbacteria bacterium]|nr:hypothetical protein [Candidatus Daviesbacteria bacterium]
MDENIAQPIYRDTPPTDSYDESTQQQEAQSEQVSQEDQISDSDFEAAKDLIPQDDYRSSPTFYETLAFLGIPANNDYLVKEKVSDVVDFAVIKSKSNQIEDILGTIRALEDRMTTPLPGESRLDRLANYVRILMKQNGLNEKFGKLLSAYEKPKTTKEDLSPEDQRTMKEKNLSLKSCEICSTDVMVRDVRKRPLCSKCTVLEPLIKKYQSFQKGGLTKAEKKSILESHTTRFGRNYGKPRKQN